MLSARPVMSREKGLEWGEGFFLSLSRPLWLSNNYPAQSSAHAGLQPSVTGTGQAAPRKS